MSVKRLILPLAMLAGLVASVPAQAEDAFLGVGYFTAKTGSGCNDTWPNVGDRVIINYLTRRSDARPSVVHYQAPYHFARSMTPKTGTNFGSSGLAVFADSGEWGSSRNERVAYRNFRLDAPGGIRVAGTIVLSFDFAAPADDGEPCFATIRAGLARSR